MRKMRDLSIKRQNRTALRRKMKWALYEEKHFKRLIEDVIDSVNDLVEMFPAAQQEQRELYEVEASEIGTSESLLVLKSIAASQDKDLESAILKALKSNVCMHMLHSISLPFRLPLYRLPSRHRFRAVFLAATHNRRDW